MNGSSREAILGRLRNVSSRAVSPRPTMPPLTELTLSHEELVARFISEVPQTGGALIQVAHLDDVREKLTEIVKTEGIGTIVISLDDVIRPLDLPAWGKEQGVTVISREDVADREAFKRVVF